MTAQHNAAERGTRAQHDATAQHGGVERAARTLRRGGVDDV